MKINIKKKRKKNNRKRRDVNAVVQGYLEKIKKNKNKNNKKCSLNNSALTRKKIKETWK